MQLLDAHFGKQVNTKEEQQLHNLKQFLALFVWRV